jgi:hypothetical protein
MERDRTCPLGIPEETSINVPPSSSKRFKNDAINGALGTLRQLGKWSKEGLEK